MWVGAENTAGHAGWGWDGWSGDAERDIYADGVGDERGIDAVGESDAGGAVGPASSDHIARPA